MALGGARKVVRRRITGKSGGLQIYLSKYTILRICAICDKKATMRIPRRELAIRQAVDRLLEILDVSGDNGSADLAVRTDNNSLLDAVVQAKGHVFMLEWKRLGSLAHVDDAISILERAKDDFRRNAIPVVCVPFMAHAGQQACAEAGVSWLDLSGNCRIEAPGLLYWILINDNDFKRPGRPESTFAPKGSRVSRLLLMEPNQWFRQQDLASKTGLTGGHISRIVRKLLETGLVERNRRLVRVADPDRLMEAWRNEYRFSGHDVIRGHINARAGDSLLREIAGTFSEIEEPYAVTALPAAWLWNRFAGFRLCTVYITRPPSYGLMKDLGFREESRGANTWLVVPEDEGVFDGAEFINGVNCVHPVQIYLDLKDHPERSAEAAEELRNRTLFRGRYDV